jgi:hypothetical protein
MKNEAAGLGGPDVPRRSVLAAALGCGGASWLATGVCAAAPVQPAGPVVNVTADSSGQFGPHTPGTRTCGVQEAIDAVRAQGGGVVHVRAGTYILSGVTPPPDDARRFNCGSQQVGLCSNLALRGDGMDRTVLVAAQHCNVNMLLGWTVSNVAIEDLTIDGAGLNGGYGLAVFGMGTSFSDVAVRRVKACNVGGSAIAVAGGRRVTVEQCVGCGAKIGFELGSPSEDYQVLHCTAYACTNGALIFDPADQFNEAGNVRPRVIGGYYAGEGRATPIAMWDCWEALVAGVSTTQGVTTNIQVSSSHRPTITTPVGGGLIEGCLAEGSIGSEAGRYGIGAFQDCVRVVACSLIGNEECGVAAGPGEGGQVAVLGCIFRPGTRNTQRYAIVGHGTRVSLLAQGNLWQPGVASTGGLLGNPAAFDIARCRVTDNVGFNPVGLLPAPNVPATGEYASNSHPFPVEVSVCGGELQAVLKRDSLGRAVTVGRGGNCTVRLEPGESLAMDYTRPPAWTWFGT